MKILRLDLTAFGPFTDRVLELGQGEEGLHIIYGPNEAGKSSALRGLRQALYGIPERSGDDFIHPYPKMRIGATLRHQDGGVLSFVRRKGRGNTLRDQDDQTPLEEVALQGFFGVVDADLFSTMFSMDHHDLVRGGREIIQGGGSLGQILFAAGAGMSNLREVQNELQTEAEALFKPSAQKPLINDALARWKANQKELRDAQLTDLVWVRHDMALNDALNRRDALEKELLRKERELGRLERINKAIPLIARRKGVMEALNRLEGTIVLPESFGERRNELLTALQIEQNTEEQTRDRIEKIRKEMESLEIPHPLLERADLIEDVYKDLGSHQKAARDRTALITRRDHLRSEAGEILKGLGRDLSFEKAEEMRLKKAEVVRIRELGNRYEGLLARLEGGRVGIAKSNAELKKVESKLRNLESPVDTGELKRVFDRTIKYEAGEEELLSEYKEIESTERSLAVLLEKQTLWCGTLEALEGLAVPSLESIDIFDDRLKEAQARVNRLDEEIGILNEALIELNGRIAKLRLEQEVPTEEDLERARLEREGLWRLVRRAWETARGEDKGLAEKYEHAVKEVDEISDRLRREAERVAMKAGLLAEQEEKKGKRELLASRVEDARKELEKIQREWGELWAPAGISPRTPREMRGWVQDLKNLTAETARVKERKIRADDLKARMDSIRTELGDHLRALGEPPIREGESTSDLFIRARDFIDRQSELRHRREELQREGNRCLEALEEAKGQVLKAEEDLAVWRRQWQEAIRPLGLDGDAGPAEVNTVVEDLKELFDKLRQADDFQKRITGIDRDADIFSRKVVHLARQVAEDLESKTAEEAAVELNVRMKRGSAAKSEYGKLTKQIRLEKERLEASSKRIVNLESELAAMCREAGCSSYMELPGAERRSIERRKLDEQLEGIEEQILMLSGGLGIEEFIREAADLNPDQIGPEIDRLAGEIRELNRERSDLDQTIGTERGELSRMDGGARAAELAEEAQMILGELESRVEHYVRLRLASTILSKAIERYREKNQGSVLNRSSELFSELTLGSFDGVRVEFDGQGNPVLMGVRGGGRELVSLEGMSDGTADQLYLALRLAGLERYLEKNEPIPFILDDILIRFDNDRARAALTVLAGLSRRTQVIFFSHHRHLVEMAHHVVEPGVLFTHDL